MRQLWFLEQFWKMRQKIIRAFAEHYIISRLPPELAFLVIEFAYSVKIGKSSVQYWYFLD